MTVKQQNTLRSQLDALVGLTAQAGFEQLILTFIRNIQGLFADDDITLITGHGGMALDERDFTDSNLQEMVEQLLQKTNSYKTRVPSELLEQPSTVVFHDQESNWVQFPLNVAIGTIGFLRISGQHPEQSILLAESHIQIFINQINLLSLNERDALTGLYNRQAFDERLKKLLENHNSNRKSDTSTNHVFALVDIDLFKRINDTLGHIYGDEVLILFARILRQSLREDDWIFRYGGEEFAIVLQNCSLQLGKGVLERVRGNVESYAFPQLERVTCSMGYTSLDARHPLGVNFQRADAALYYAKEHGRNQTHAFEVLVEAGSLRQKAPSTGEIELF
jgi:diguanylate cyclase (GGDEF)-like protein